MILTEMWHLHARSKGKNHRNTRSISQIRGDFQPPPVRISGYVLQLPTPSLFPPIARRGGCRDAVEPFSVESRQ